MEKGDRKKLWDNNNKLRGKSTKGKQECTLFNPNGEQLDKTNAEEEIKHYWTNMKSTSAKYETKRLRKGTEH